MDHSPIRPKREDDPSPSCEPSPLQARLNELRERLLEAPDAEQPLSDEGALNRLVREVLESRRRRERIFGDQIFGEPAWDLLLELYDAEWRQQPLSIQNACRATGMPPSTMIRWIAMLEEEGWVRAIGDPSDLVRMRVALTDRASVAMHDYFRNLPIRPV